MMNSVSWESAGPLPELLPQQNNHLMNIIVCAADADMDYGGDHQATFSTVLFRC